jgi:membrane protein DedA with SNARE-associated domain
MRGEWRDARDKNLMVESVLHHAGWLLFVWVFVNQGGVPVPVVPSLIAAGALAGAGGPSFVVALVAAVGAALCADLVWYSVGRWHGSRALAVFCRASHRPATCVDRAETLFRAHDLGFRFWARFLPELNPIAAGLAGAAGVNLARYVLVASGSALVWAGTWTTVGYLLRDVTADVAARVGLPLLALAVVALAARLAVAYARRLRQRRHA